ncbi:MAG: ATP-dependent helicase [Candidatus Eremiobacteraeota bacterium]|nr:ATP-dependent helicase [Candidatus Eremiobacteraeota bacterium]
MHVLCLCGRLCTAAGAGTAPLRILIALDLTEEQRRAVDAPWDRCVAILGPPSSGKTFSLRRRAERARAQLGDDGVLELEAERGVDAFAFSLLTSQRAGLRLLDDAHAEMLFERACSPLLALEWLGFGDEFDFEVAGLRMPGRFIAAAFRLIRRLRDAAVTPAEFLSDALRGATEFYAKPPNFADPALLVATKSQYHDSLDVTTDELLRQRRLEIDLAKILHKLFEAYVSLVETSGMMTGRDAVIAATQMLGERAQAAAEVREAHRVALVDEAQDLTRAQLAFLTAVFGEQLCGVTLCGDPASAISTVRMAAPEAAFARATERIELLHRRRSARVEIERGSTVRDECATIVAAVRAWIDRGVAPHAIAVLFRSVEAVERYENALLDAGIPALVTGDVNLFRDRRVLNALALLWNVHDPFRHDWLLRTLGGPAFGLSDASLAALCAEPADPQRALFPFEEEPPSTAPTPRWSSKRDLRLGYNVLYGECDDALPAEALRRVRRFRALRLEWLEALATQSFEALVRRVWRDGLARDGEAGSARAQAQEAVLHGLLQRLAGARESQRASLGDVLEYAERCAAGEIAPAARTDDQPEGFVRIRSVEAALGREYSCVVVADVRPGAFPLWYAADAFLFSRQLGMIPKDNVGDAHASRTAKFSYYMFRMKAAQQYYERERRAFRYALSRAKQHVLVTASGTPTRGISAPEFLEELR